MTPPLSGPYNGRGSTMHLSVPTTPPIAVVVASAPPPAAAAPPAGNNPQAPPEPPKTHRVRRVPLRLRPPFHARLKVGALIPDDPHTRRDTGTIQPRLEWDIAPLIAQQGKLRGRALTFVTLGYSTSTQNRGGSTLNIGSVSLCESFALPRHINHGKAVSNELGRVSVGGGYGLYILGVSRGGESHAALKFGSDASAEYLVGRNIFVQVRYHFIGGGLKGESGSGPALMIGRRY